MSVSSKYDNIGFSGSEGPYTGKTSSTISGGSDTPTSGAIESDGKYGYEEICKKYFNSSSPIPHYTRKELERPLLKYTPDNEIVILRKIWKVMHRYLDENDDQNQQIAVKDLKQEPIMVTLRRIILKTDHLALTGEHSTKPDNKKKKSNRTGTVSWSKFGTVTSSLAARLKNKAEDYEMSDELNGLHTSLDYLQYIIGCAILKPDIRDEVYCMTLQLLTRTPTKAKTYRGWLLLAALTSCIKASDKILLHIAKFIEDSKSCDSVGIRKMLVRTSQNGDRYQPLSNFEYLSLVHKRAMELPVTLMDGASYNVVVDCSTTSEEVITSLATILNLKDKFGFSVYVSMNSKVTSLGSDSDKLFDSISSCEQLYYRTHGRYPESFPARFFLRKELFSPWQGIDPTTSDPVAMKLVYSQIVRGIPLKEYFCATDDQLALLIAQQYLVEYGVDLSKAGLRSFLPYSLPLDKLVDPSGRSLQESWLDKVLQAYARFRQSNPKLFDKSDTVLSSRIMTEVVKTAKQEWMESFSKRYRVNVLQNEKTDSVEAALKINSSGMILTNGRNARRIEYHMISELSCYNSQLRTEYKRSLSSGSQQESDSGCSSNSSNISNIDNSSKSNSVDNNICNGETVTYCNKVVDDSCSTGNRNAIENQNDVSANDNCENNDNAISDIEAKCENNDIKSNCNSRTNSSSATNSADAERNINNCSGAEARKNRFDLLETTAYVSNQTGSTLNEFEEISVVADEDIVSAKSDTVEMNLWDGCCLLIRTPEAWNIYRIISHIHQGLRSRSVWAVVKSQCFGDNSKNFIDCERGDLIRLARSCQQEAMTSISCVGENMRTNKIGRVPVDTLHILSVSRQPDDSLMTLIKKFI